MIDSGRTEGIESEVKKANDPELFVDGYWRYHNFLDGCHGFLADTDSSNYRRS